MTRSLFLGLITETISVCVPAETTGNAVKWLIESEDRVNCVSERGLGVRLCHQIAYLYGVMSYFYSKTQ